jgi:PTS system nitrogen regulatory IIA component
MQLKQILDQASCTTGLEARNRDEAIRGIAALLAENPSAREVPLQTLVEGLLDREKLGTTGVGGGVAIPHCRIDSMKGFALALAVCRRGVNWNSMDGRSAHIICGIAGPEDATDDHLRILAGAARVLGTGKARHEILSSDTPFAMREAFLYHLAPVTSRLEEGRRDKRKMVILILQEEPAYNRVMELFLEGGVEGAVTINASMMGTVLSGVPIFAGFMDVLGRSRPEPRVVITLIPDDRVDDIVSEIEEITGNLDTHRGACILVMEPFTVRGSLETL